jgi:hypothetical protein
MVPKGATHLQLASYRCPGQITTKLDTVRTMYHVCSTFKGGYGISIKMFYIGAKFFVETLESPDLKKTKIEMQHALLPNLNAEMHGIIGV